MQKADVRVMFLLMRNKCNITNVQQNAKLILYNYYGLFVNFSMMIRVKSCLTCRLIKFKCYICLHHLVSQIMAHRSHVICVCFLYPYLYM